MRRGVVRRQSAIRSPAAFAAQKTANRWSVRSDARAVLQIIDVDGAKQRIDADLREPRTGGDPLGFGEVRSRDQARMRDHDEIGVEVPDDLQESHVGDPAPRSRGTKQGPVSRDVAVAEEMHEVAVAGEAVGELAL